jgi:hypothetical protein
MSMILVLTSISDRTTTQVLSDPPLIWRLLAPDDMEAYQKEDKKHKSVGLLSRLLGRSSKKESTKLPKLDLEEWEGTSQDLDKSWHGIHYLLTKTAWEGIPPINFLLKGGQEVPNIEVGYGSARIFTSEVVHKIHDAISQIDVGYLKSRFDPKDMMAKEIYPSIWDRDPSEDDTLGYCLEYFEVLKQFIADSSQNNHGFVVTIQ